MIAVLMGHKDSVQISQLQTFVRKTGTDPLERNACVHQQGNASALKQAAVS